MLAGLVASRRGNTDCLRCAVVATPWLTRRWLRQSAHCGVRPPWRSGRWLWRRRGGSLLSDTQERASSGSKQQPSTNNSKKAGGDSIASRSTSPEPQITTGGCSKDLIDLHQSHTESAHQDRVLGSVGHFGRKSSRAGLLRPDGAFANTSRLSRSPQRAGSVSAARS